MSKLSEVISLDEKVDIYSTTDDDIHSTTDEEASTEDDVLQEKDINLDPTSIYSLIGDKLKQLKEHLENNFEQIELTRNWNEYGFDVKLFTITKESKCNLVQVMKRFIRNKDEYVKTYGRETFILIAENCENCDDSLKSGFAICTGTAYHTVIPYVDTTFAYSVSKKILNPETVRQWKCRYLNGRTLWVNKLFHKNRMSASLPTVVNDSFYIAEGFQAQIKDLSHSGLDFLSSLSSSIKVTRFRLQIMKSLSMDEMFCFMKELLHVHLSDKYTDAEEFEFLTDVKPVESLDLRKKLDHHLENNFLPEIKVNRNGFSICHNKYQEWVKCEIVQLSEKTEHGKVEIKTWKSEPTILNICDALGETHRDWSSLQIRYKSNGKWRSDKFINYIHGHVIYEKKYYFHIGKDWFQVDVEYIRRMDYIFFKLVKEKLLLENDEGYLPLPWCSEKQSNERINAEHCITFCRGVLHKKLSDDDMRKISDICLRSDQTSEQGRLPPLQDNEERRESLSAGNKSDNVDEENNPPHPDSDDPVGNIELSLSHDDDGANSKDDDDGNSVTKRKQRSKREERRNQYVSAVTSPLSNIIGEVECQLCLESLTSRDEEKYNKMYYMLLNKFLEENPSNELNETLGVDPNRKFPTFLLGDKILVENVELFDILKITENKLYLYHVKEGVGQKTRDAASQIRISANLIWRAMAANQTQDILGKWYEQITNYKGEDKTRKKLKENLAEQKEKFLDLFLHRKIVYVYAFLDDAKDRKPFNELVSDKQCLLTQEDFNKALDVKSQVGLKEKIDLLWDYLKSNVIISEKDNGFNVERKFLDLNTKTILQNFKSKGFSDKQANQLFETVQKHFVPTASVKSHIAKFELIRLAHDFKSSYSTFELSFCQIKKP